MRPDTYCSGALAGSHASAGSNAAGKSDGGKRGAKSGAKGGAKGEGKGKDAESPLQLQERAEIEQKIKAWAQGAASGPRQDSAPDCLTFSASLSGFGRKVVHETAEALVLPCCAPLPLLPSLVRTALSCWARWLAYSAFALCAPIPGLAGCAAPVGMLRHAVACSESL